MSASASANATTDHNQWKQFYDQHQTHQIVAPQTEGLLFSCDSTVMTTMAAPAASSESILSPKGSVAKPIRRRSRASKKTPTTLLNANTTNFRALVQKFTGCPNSSSSNSIMSLVGAHNKGPITLNFQQGSSSARTTIIPSSFVVGGGSGKGYYYDDHNQVQQQLAAATTTTNHNDNTLLPWQKQQDHQLQGQESGYSFDEHVMNSYNDNNNNSIGVSSDDHGLMMIMDNDFSLHDLAVSSNAFPNHDTY